MYTCHLAFSLVARVQSPLQHIRVGSSLSTKTELHLSLSLFLSFSLSLSLFLSFSLSLFLSFSLSLSLLYFSLSLFLSFSLSLFLSFSLSPYVQHSDEQCEYTLRLPDSFSPCCALSDLRFSFVTTSLAQVKTTVRVSPIMVALPA